MPKISKVVDLTKVNRRHSEIVFRTSKCDALHLEIYTGITAEPDATAELYVKKPNGKIVSQACTMYDTVATIDVLSGATDIPGVAEGIVKITDSEGEYCTPSFHFAILDSFAHEDSTGIGTGITAEQAAQIQANKNDIADIINNKLDGKTFKFLTQAEYDVLPESEKNNETIEYHITDAPENSHTHTNKEVLDKISEDTDGSLLFNGNKITSNSTSGGITTVEYENLSTNLQSLFVVIK